MTTAYAPTRHRLSADDFLQMARSGILHEDDRIELIDGDLIDMAPIGSEHASLTDWFTRYLVLAIGQHAIVRIQSSLSLDKHSQPQPDVQVLRAREDYYRKAHPSAEDVLLLIEVSDTTARFDRTVKIPLYARHGVAEVWLVDVAQRSVEVYRDPQPATSTYRQMTAYRRGLLIPQQLPMVSIAVEQLF
ncbi:MAG: Uma2 family endonuclease [Candidatus Competibacter denitrificans]|jgi:Uma2 family endonuclease